MVANEPLVNSDFFFNNLQPRQGMQPDPIPLWTWKPPISPEKREKKLFSSRIYELLLLESEHKSHVFYTERVVPCWPII